MTEKRKRGRPLAPCGTPAAYQRHRTRGEDCALCKAAHATYTKERNYRTGRTKPRPSISKKKDFRLIVIQAKLDRGGCEDCARPITPENYFAFDLDHINPEDKSFTIGEKAGHVSRAELLDEIAKCRLLCAYCHRIRTYRDRHHLIQVARERRLGIPSHPELWEQYD